MDKQSYKQNSGFTLIEALIAALVVGIGMMGLAKLQGQFFLAGSDARMRTQAINLAQEKIEALRNFANKNTYTAFASGSNEEIIQNSSSANFTRSWEIGDCPNTVNCKNIEVSVRWTDPQDQTQTVQLNSYIAEADPVRSGIILASATTSTTTTTTAAPSSTTVSTTTTTSSSSSTTSTTRSSTSSSTSTTGSSSSTSSSTTSSSTPSTSTTLRSCSVIVQGTISKATDNGGKNANSSAVSVTATPGGKCSKSSATTASGIYTCPAATVVSGTAIIISGNKISGDTAVNVTCTGTALAIAGPSLFTTP
ncbi:type IV pilus modification PilV family protein [Methylosoma difficile]